MRFVVWVALGGALGAVARFLVGGMVSRVWPEADFPWATFLVNVVGCLLIGVAVALIERMPSHGFEARLFVVTGLLGGFTTFSAFGVETLSLLRRGATGLAVTYALGSLVVGVGAVALGLWLGNLTRGPVR